MKRLKLFLKYSYCRFKTEYMVPTIAVILLVVIGIPVGAASIFGLCYAFGLLNLLLSGATWSTAISYGGGFVSGLGTLPFLAVLYGGLFFFLGIVPLPRKIMGAWRSSEKYDEMKRVC